ncbi:MAG TPA: hypothetical protein VEC56_10660 [Candidatus Krumholzibacteria bacterium]|nr:hypothetical protein [Candidatus Krumholzibacteria bacterium]
MSRSLRIVALLALVHALACSRATEPELVPEGRIVMRFEPAALASAVARDASRATAATTVIDSVVVRVFRPGTPVTQEVAGSAAVGVDPVELSIPCIAENGKRVSVELYQSGYFTHHGYRTGVDVAVGRRTDVTVDAYVFLVASLSVTPSVVVDPESFDLAWTGAPAASRYDVQASGSLDFGTIDWEASVTDTFLTVQLPTGSHYFRVVPRTDYAQGLASIPEFGYVMGGSGQIAITGFSAPAAIPGDVMTILGENLDFPGTRVWIGSMEMTIVSASWGSLDVRVPRAATTEYISASSLLGTDTSDDALIVQRVAYVTSSGEWAAEYMEVLFGYWSDYGYSGVAPVPIADLDWRDMSVFDIVIVADDTGTDTGDWGDGVPARALAIAASTANVLALGEGGLAYLQLAVPSISDANSQPRNQTSYYVTTPSASVLTTPHTVTSGGLAQWVDISSVPERTIGVDIDSASPPAGVNLHACTGLVIVLPNDLWALVDFQLPDIFSNKKRLFYYGHSGSPKRFTKAGADLLGNLMYHLYNDRATVPPVAAAR